MLKHHSIIAILVAVFCANGCQHLHLRHKTVRQAETLSTIYEQQVLDNLAMFVENPYAIPFFAFPTKGDANLTDDGELKTDSFNAFRIGIGGSFKRSAFEGWELEPVRDSEKLRLMRCAYQRAVGCIGNHPICDSCLTREKDFLGEDGQSEILNCENYCGWFCHGTLKDVPKDCCGLVGHYCGTYVWIPDSGRDHFARLVMRILDYGVHDPVEKQLKSIEYFVSRDGEPTDEKNAVGVVSAVVPLDTKNVDVFKGAKLSADEINEQNKSGNNAPKNYMPHDPTLGRPSGGIMQFRKLQRSTGAGR